MKQSKSIKFMSKCIMIGLILFSFISVYFVSITDAAQTSPNIYFLLVGESYVKDKSNELIPAEGPAIWHVITNYDNDSLYILFDICDPTNPGYDDQDKLYFYLDFSDDEHLTHETVFGYTVQRNGMIRHFRFDSSLSQYYEVSKDLSEGLITIQPDWKVFYEFNYTKFGYPTCPMNQTIKIHARYRDHVIGSTVFIYTYPSGSADLNRYSWSTGYFIEGHSQVNDTTYIWIWVLVGVIAAGFAIIIFKPHKKKRHKRKYPRSSYQRNLYPQYFQPRTDLVYPNSRDDEEDNDSDDNSDLWFLD